MIPKYVILLVLVAAVNARTTSPTQNQIPDEGRSSEDIGLGDLKIAYDTYKECTGSELANCLKLKLAKALNRIAKSEQVTLLSGVTLIKDSNANVPAEPEQDIEEALPRGLEEKEGALDNMIFDKIVGFFKTHTLQIKLPAGSDLQRALDEGRGRRKKLAPLLLIPLLIGGTMVPLAFGALALLAGKALIVSKLALVLAGIIGLKKLLSGGGGGHEAHEVVVSAGHGNAGWGRTYQEAQNLAYNAYKQ